jgi:outer membrane protein assembly factor BamB
MIAALLCIVNACASTARIGPAMQERAWRTYLGAPERAGAARDSLSADPQPVWRADLGRGIIGAPAVTEDVVAIAQVDRQVALLDRATGEVIWRRRVPANLGTGPLISDDRIFAATQTSDGRVYALRLPSGRTAWSVAAGDVVAPLTLEGAGLYVASSTGWVMRLGTDTGSRLWRTRVTGAVRATPTLAGGALVVATAADSLFALDAQTGAVLARRSTRGTVLAAPALADSLVIAGTSDGRLEAFEPRSLLVRWSLDLEGPVVGHVAVREGTAFALAGRGTLWAIPLADPAAARRLELGIVTRAGPAPAAGGVFIAAVGGEITLVDAAGVRRWGTRLDAPVSEPPIVDNRTILAVSRKGEVVAYR